MKITITLSSEDVVLSESVADSFGEAEANLAEAQRYYEKKQSEQEARIEDNEE